MRKLAIAQRALLKTHLLKKRIEFVELYDEIYDHYASAYEQGNEDLELIITHLDHHFTQEYIDHQREKVQKGIYKNIASIYKKELINFFQWPLIMISLLTALLIVILTHFIPHKSFEFYIFFPSLALFIIPSAYFFIQIHRKLILPFNLKSASYEAIGKAGIIPTILFNSLNFMSIVFGDSTTNTHNPYILGISVLMIVCYSIITIMVFKRKIKYQLA